MQVLQGYLMGGRGLAECAEWLAGIDWDDPKLTREEKDALGLFELLLTEVAEGLREEREFREAAAEFVAKRSESVFIWQVFPAVSVAVGTADLSSSPVIAVSADRESRSWSISLQVVPS
jgi:uncharacterized protein with von Willebrand factor type A (vWA) domain